MFDTGMSARSFAAALAILKWGDEAAAHELNLAMRNPTPISAATVARYREGRLGVPRTVALAVKLRLRGAAPASSAKMTADALQDFMQRTGWTQRELAVRLNDAMGRSYRFQDVSKWLHQDNTGRGVPSSVAIQVRVFERELAQAADKSASNRADAARRKKVQEVAERTGMPREHARELVRGTERGRKVPALG